MKHFNFIKKYSFLMASALVGAILSGCSSVQLTTLDGKPAMDIPNNIDVPSGTVLIAAVCIPSSSAVVEDNTAIRFGKIFKKGSAFRKMKSGYPEKMNDRYWYIQDLGDLNKLEAFVLPDSYDKNQKMKYVWNVRDRKIDYEWTPWLNPELKVSDISSYVDEEWGLVNREDFTEDDKSPFLVKFKKITYRDFILEQINHWNLNKVAPCEIPIKEDKKEDQNEMEKK